MTRGNTSRFPAPGSRGHSETAIHAEARPAKARRSLLHPALARPVASAQPLRASDTWPSRTPVPWPFGVTLNRLVNSHAARHLGLQVQQPLAGARAAGLSSPQATSHCLVCPSSAPASPVGPQRRRQHHQLSGQTKEATVTFEDPGEILYGCHIEGHYDAGMVGTVTVTGS